MSTTSIFCLLHLLLLQFSLSSVLVAHPKPSLPPTFHPPRSTQITKTCSNSSRSSSTTQTARSDHGEALCFSCVPVVITDRPIPDLPFSNVLRWQKIAMFVRGSGRVVRVLKRMLGHECW
ncbi:hypothetical protein ACFX1X_044334 [Malus domestica]